MPSGTAIATAIAKAKSVRRTVITKSLTSVPLTTPSQIACNESPGRGQQHRVHQLEPVDQPPQGHEADGADRRGQRPELLAEHARFPPATLRRQKVLRNDLTSILLLTSPASVAWSTSFWKSAIWAAERSRTMK